MKRLARRLIKSDISSRRNKRWKVRIEEDEDILITVADAGVGAGLSASVVVREVITYLKAPSLD